MIFSLNKRLQGKVFEELTAKYLTKRGFSIIQKNFTIHGGEIDLITKYKNLIVFVEVKSLRSEQFIKLEETITRKKQRTLIKACQIWLYNNHLENINWRIDFLGVVKDKDGKINRLQHLVGAIY